MNPHLSLLLPVVGILAVVLVIFVVSAVVIVAFVVTASAASRQRHQLRIVERKLDALLQHHGVETPPALSPEVQELAKDPAQKIAAIKLHREQTGATLADAKAAVEAFMGR